MVNYYGIFYTLAGISAFLILYSNCKEKKLKFETYFEISLKVLIFSLIGSRLFGYFWFNYISNYKVKLSDFTHSTGFFYGGFLFGSFFLYYKSLKQKVSFLYNCDILAPSLSIAQSIGRIGCFLSGCCYGKHLFFFERFPIQIIESIYCLFLFLHLTFKKNIKFNGEIFLKYIFLYSNFRFFIEFLRDDYRGKEILNLKISQIISLIFIIISLIFIFYNKIFRKKNIKFMQILL